MDVLPRRDWRGELAVSSTPVSKTGASRVFAAGCATFCAVAAWLGWIAIRGQKIGAPVKSGSAVFFDRSDAPGSFWALWGLYVAIAVCAFVVFFRVCSRTKRKYRFDKDAI